MTTIIHSNGSKWAGEENCTIEELIDVLEHHKLDLPRFACHGFVNFVDNNDGKRFEDSEVNIHGNFADISHFFNINGIYHDLEPLIKAIELNIKRQCE